MLISQKLTHLSLFSGIGGLDLAAETAGFQTVGQCEWADYPTKVLEKHWPDIPRWRDIRTLTKESFYERTGLRTVDLLSGGFPCQPFSIAGKRRGCADDRYLWPEMFRVVKELRPAWILGENVAHFVNMALDRTLSDLEGIGYRTRTFVLPACAVDAPHQRKRCAIVAHTGGQRRQGRHQQPGTPDQRREKEPYRPVGKCRETAIRERWTAQPGLGGSPDGLSAWMDSTRLTWADGSWESGIPRTAVHIPHRADRLKCLGNAVVPQQFFPVLQAIYVIETGGET